MSRSRALRHILVLDELRNFTCYSVQSNCLGRESDLYAISGGNGGGGGRGHDKDV